MAAEDEIYTQATSFLTETSQSRQICPPVPSRVEANFTPETNHEPPDLLPAPSPVLSRDRALHVAHHLQSELMGAGRTHGDGEGRGELRECHEARGGERSGGQGRTPTKEEWHTKKQNVWN